ncbi:15832_t:CDS:2 [Rhizophagus irregularis]|nr:15832_t:CDS:2 [Rhizophagus irregularis]
MLEKRQEEVSLTNIKLKSVMELLKRTTTPKSFTKAFRNHIRKQSISRNDEDRKESGRSSDDFSPIYDEVFASGYDKKKLLDEEIYKYISDRQTLTMMMDEWIIITSEIGNELGGDAQALDDKIEMITSEIAYINAKIHSLQLSIAGEYSKESEDKSRKNSIKSSKIERNFDEYESYTILESFFKEIVDSRTGDWS